MSEKITNLRDYIEDIQDIERKVSNDNNREKLYFRGQADASWKLEPSVFRGYLYNENNLYHEMERNLYHELAPLSTPLDRLIYMQHHGLPTRLLDITKNSLVALYFACVTHQKCDDKIDKENKELISCSDEENNCKDKKCSDGVVYYFIEENEKFPKKKAEIISLLAKIEHELKVGEYIELIKDELGYDISQEDLVEYLNEEKILVTSNRNNNRVIKQDGDFFLFSNNSEELEKIKYDLKRNIDENSLDKKLGKIVIDKEYKEDILKELDNIGINQYTLFPEAEYLAKYLKGKLFDDGEEVQKIKSLNELTETFVEEIEEISFEEEKRDVNKVKSISDVEKFEATLQKNLKNFVAKHSINIEDINNAIKNPNIANEQIKSLIKSNLKRNDLHMYLEEIDRIYFETEYEFTTF